jgi:hypothetical protein
VFSSYVFWNIRNKGFVTYSDFQETIMNVANLLKCFQQMIYGKSGICEQLPPLKVKEEME